jgi:hypothetical protein
VRSVVLFIVLLTAAKFGYQEWVFRSAITDALLNTYRQDAVQRCQVEARQRNLALGYDAWNDPDSVRVTVGQPGREMGAFDITSDSPRSPGAMVVIVARKEPAEVRCDFDIVRMTATVTQL